MSATQHEQLAYDVAYLADIAIGNLPILASAAAEPDPHRACYLLALTDLFWQVHQYAGAIHVLIREQLHLPLLVCQRGLFESGTAMGYLRLHGKAEFEGAVLLAYSYLKDIEDHSEQTELLEERNALLARMPADAVQTARKRMSRRPRTWSGLSFRELVARGGMAGFDKFYGPLSGSAHAARSGRYFRIVKRGDDHFVTTGWPINGEEAEVQSNFARRVLHGAFKIMWSENGGAAGSLNTSNPNDWLRPAASASDLSSETP
jgi:hypothetical protein